MSKPWISREAAEALREAWLIEDMEDSLDAVAELLNSFFVVDAGNGEAEEALVRIEGWLRRRELERGGLWTDGTDKMFATVRHALRAAKAREALDQAVSLWPADLPEKVAFWGAVNRYAHACGEDPSKNLTAERMDAVAAVSAATVALAVIYAAPTPDAIRHGHERRKVQHDGRGGHLHDAGDDYVDGLPYCGRCHYALPKEG